MRIAQTLPGVTPKAGSPAFAGGSGGFGSRPPGTLNLAGQAQVVDLPGAHSDFGGVFSNLLSGIMAIAALLVFLYLIWGGIEWITSGGDKSKVEGARNKITQAMVGLIVLSATTALFMLLQNFLDICVLDFGGGCSASVSAPATPTPPAKFGGFKKSGP